MKKVTHRYIYICLIFSALFLVSCNDSSNGSSGSGISSAKLMRCGGSDPGTNYDCVASLTTDKIWLDRNLGASRVCTAFDDAANDTDATCYGDLYQWGRNTDGHEKRNSNTANGQIAWDETENTDFLIGGAGSEWAIGDDEAANRKARWAATDGSSICPAGFRVPTRDELEAERIGWTPNNTMGAFASALKLPAAGSRSNATPASSGSVGAYWSNDFSAFFVPYGLAITSSVASLRVRFFINGYNVRCIHN